ncbi:hypothetical protein [Nocardiopsis ansamitocini]|uniref:Uncharacterized protein n=1 Tax=Nocardiopsis ansamitocini TaxID=1670832 RepID=A0A9W6UL29_9ACTN|nr:hypothetical protein [Nocardiopsis ansamitocini]GLU50312.1 hypothetical protein Nans01_46630 [Nocardiopsis ansamitocini]
MRTIYRRTLAVGVSGLFASALLLGASAPAQAAAPPAQGSASSSGLLGGLFGGGGLISIFIGNYQINN